MNNIIIIGNTTKEPVVRTSQSGTQIATFNIAVPSRRKDKDGNYLTDFFTAVCYGHVAKFVENYIIKGTRVAINGSIHIRDYETKEGIKSRAVEIDVITLEKLSTPNQPPQSQDLPNLDEVVVPEDDDELPF